MFVFFPQLEKTTCSFFKNTKIKKLHVIFLEHRIFGTQQIKKVTCKFFGTQHIKMLHVNF